MTLVRVTYSLPESESFRDEPPVNLFVLLAKFKIVGRIRIHLHSRASFSDNFYTIETHIDRNTA